MKNLIILNPAPFSRLGEFENYSLKRGFIFKQGFWMDLSSDEEEREHILAKIKNKPQNSDDLGEHDHFLIIFWYFISYLHWYILKFMLKIIQRKNFLGFHCALSSSLPG